MTADLLSATEVAAVSRVGLRNVNRVIDEHILPEAMVSRVNGRWLSSDACMFIAFYYQTASQLTADERKLTISSASKLLKRWRAPKAKPSDWVIWRDSVGIDLAPFAKTIDERLCRLAEAREMVASDPDILGGVPVFKGSRVPVHDVAASVAAGISHERILGAYPSLDANKIDLAVLYAEANPLQGRPRAGKERLTGVMMVEDRRVARHR